jgi:uncharacterized membrane protein
MRSRWLAPACIAVVLAFGAAVYAQLPERVPSHWNIYGAVDGTIGRLAAVLLPPAIIIGVWLLLLAVPRIDPLRSSYTSFVGILFFAAVQVVVIGAALGWPVGVPQVIGVGAGLLFMVLGNEMGRLKPNWFAGIRTPWTLSDPENWRRTHRFGGKIFFVAGLLIAAANLLLPATASAFVVLAGTLGAAVLSVGYSYLLWRQQARA